MNKNIFIFKKDTTSRFQENYAEYSNILSSGVVAFLFSLSLNSQNQMFESVRQINAGFSSLEWKIDSAKKISLAPESVRLQKRLAYIVELCSDDEDVMPIGVASISNMQKILMDVQDTLLKGWNLYPNNNGTLSLELKEDSGVSAIISIGYNMISYSIEKAEQMHIVGKEPFSFEAVESLLIKMA